jgi:caspase domain-containing protein
VIRSLLVLVLLAGAAHANVTRYALVVGDNRGERDEVELRYAEQDAERMTQTLVDLGGFAPGNVVLLRGSDAETVRASLIGLNDRIRTGGGDALLLVYYSGHADADALHMDATKLALPQLEQLVRGSSAAFRLLVLDTCRSGALTRVKGGRPVAPFPIVLGDTLAADGVLFWTASGANEDAQESDDIKASFFTHYLVSGLAGPADADHDGSVTTSEAFAYARESTLRASSRTLAGTQHPTFRDEVRGRTEVVLTQPGTVGPRRAVLRIPDGRDALVLAGSDSGTVVAEVGVHDRTRGVNVRPGRYFIRERGEHYLLEGTVAVAAAEDRIVRDDELARVDYARLVRKGGGRSRQDGLELGAAMRTPLVDGGSPCIGMIGGYTIELPWVGITPRLATCRETAKNPFVAAATDELAGELRVTHAWDVGPVTLAAQIQLGGALLHQTFDSTGTAPARTIGALSFGGGGLAAIDLMHGLQARAGTEVATYVMRRDEAMDTGRWSSRLALRLVLALGVAF